jgi:hypothetical protein
MTTLNTRRFTLTGQHVALLRRAYVRWDGSEYGAPCIDPKRPYGNSNVANDVADILGYRWDRNDWYEMPSDLRERCDALHRETENALQVVLQHGYQVGTYEADPYSHQWRAVAATGTNQ